MKLLIIIPAYNEAENLERVIATLADVCPQYEYLIVNDGSKDRTEKLCREKHFQYISHPVNLGLAAGVQTGMMYAIENGYDLAIQFDGDGQHDPRYIKEMVECMERTGADIVVGSRFVTKKKPRTLRMMGSNIIEACIKLTTGMKISDPTSGMRLFNRRMMEIFALHMNVGPEPDTISYMIRCGAHIEQTQVAMHDRIAGESYLNLRRSIQYMMRMCISILLIQWFRERKVL